MRFHEREQSSAIVLAVPGTQLCRGTCQWVRWCSACCWRGCAAGPMVVVEPFLFQQTLAVLLEPVHMVRS